MSNKAETAAFHLQLLSKVINTDKYPFTKLIIDKGLTEQEYNKLMNRISYLNCQYLKQSEEGLLDFTSLLLHFVGMLTEKLEPNKTIIALKKEGYYPSLMDEFLKIIDHIKD
ncbi:DUF1878 family protein [Cerasibacillus sp. JNUCC 74]|jgi:hypothetical protein|uniref:DUF1878 family protein n=1 Tax=Virgibacillus proomii TaxID=84407 RepID=UPI0009870C10|nr:DUF1878 family protein [Virgibacillus proomii]